MNTSCYRVILLQVGHKTIYYNVIFQVKSTTLFFYTSGANDTLLYFIDRGFPFLVSKWICLDLFIDAIDWPSLVNSLLTYVLRLVFLCVCVCVCVCSDAKSNLHKAMLL